MIDARHGALALALLLGGCATTATQTTLSNVTDKFSQVVSSSSSLLKTEIDNKPKVRRGEALEHFLNRPGDANNFTGEDMHDAFAVYVCAGANSLQKEKAFLDFAAAYAGGAQGIVKPGGNSFAEQWKKYQDLRKPVEIPKLHEQGDSRKPFDVCRGELTAADGPLAFKGVSIFDNADEMAPGAILGAIEAYRALFDALEKAATDGLKVANQIEARNKFKNYVLAVHDRFAGTLSTDLSADRLKDSWQRRKAYALWAPYQTFARIVTIRKKQTGELDAARMYEIKELALKLESELAEYDALRKANPPDKMVAALTEAEAAVYAAATKDDISLDSIVEFLTLLLDDLKTAQSDYDAIAKAAANAQSASKTAWQVGG
jgi:hypothetical protein